MPKWTPELNEEEWSHIQGLVAQRLRELFDDRWPDSWTDYENKEFDVLVGVSPKLEHMIFMFSAVDDMGRRITCK